MRYKGRELRVESHIIQVTYKLSTSFTLKNENLI